MAWMINQWQLMQRNVGVWRGCFDTMDRSLALIKRQPSVLTLQLAPSGTSIDLTLLLWSSGLQLNDNPFAGDPEKRICQSFMRVEPDLGFFSTGSFSRGTVHVSAWTKIFAEFCFLEGDRRHRSVLLWDVSGRLDRVVSIPEFRDGVVQQPCQPLTKEQLLGAWSGTEETLFAGSHELSCSPWSGVIEPSTLDGVQYLQDGGGFRIPHQVVSQQAFSIEAWWLSSFDCLQRLTRSYDASGALLSTRSMLLRRLGC